MAAGLLAVVLVAHGAALFDGPFFDDRWQSEALRCGGWDWHSLIEAATFEVPSRLNHAWWQDQPLQIRYARPVAMLLVKLEHVLTGGDPVALHAFGLAWHWLTGLLVYRLAFWAIGDRRWAFAAGCLFLIHPHSVVTIGWIAAQNALFSGLFFVAAMLAYLRASSGPSLRRGLFAGSLLLWAGAVLCRESAIVLPLLPIVLDLGLGGWPHLRRRAGAHAVLWLLAAGYLAWRLTLFAAAQPPEPYFHAPHGLADLAWLATNLLRMLVALLFHTPMFADLSAAAGLSLRAIVLPVLLALVLLPPGIWYVKVSHGSRGRWLWPVWSVAAFVPVLPVIMLPHFAYLSAAGWSIMLAIFLSRLRGRSQWILTGLVFALTVWSVGVYRVAWRGIVRSEQIVHADLRADAAPAGLGTTVFLINLPMAAVYAPPALRQAWDLPDLEGYVLTFAPGTLRAEQSCSVEVLGPNELLVSLPRPGCFSGPAGRMLLDLTRRGAPLAPGRAFHAEAFDATVVQSDPAGVTRIRFTFARPLDTPQYRFYVSCAEGPTRRLRFDTPVDANEQARQTLVWRQANARVLAESERYFRLMDIVGRIVRSEVFLTEDGDGR